VRVAKVGTEIQSRLLAKIPPADLETCQRVLDRIERELEERQESIPAAVVKRGE